MMLRICCKIKRLERCIFSIGQLHQQWPIYGLQHDSRSPVSEMRIPATVGLAVSCPGAMAAAGSHYSGHQRLPQELELS